MTIHPQNLKSIENAQKVENQTMRNNTTQKLKTFSSSFFVFEILQYVYADPISY